MPRAIWKNTVIAESTDTVVVEGNHYFPRECLNDAYVNESLHTSHCGWKGEARYFNVSVNGETNANAAWYYPTPKPAAKAITGRVAFWKGVQVEE